MTVPVYSTPASTVMSGAPSTFNEGDKINEAALKDLIRAAVALNLKGKKQAQAKVHASQQQSGPASFK